jgi:hypothetical protein
VNRRVEKLEMATQDMAEKFREAFQEGVIEVKKERSVSISSNLRLVGLILPASIVQVNTLSE